MVDLELAEQDLRAARVIDVRMREHDQRERLREVRSAREECLQIPDKVVRAVHVAVRLAARIDQDRAARKLDQRGRTLPYVDQMHAHRRPRWIAIGKEALVERG